MIFNFQSHSNSQGISTDGLLLDFKGVNCINVDFTIWLTAAVAQGTRALAPQEEGWVYESQFLQTLVLNTGSDLSTAKRSAIGVNATGPRIWSL